MQPITIARLAALLVIGALVSPARAQLLGTIEQRSFTGPVTGATILFNIYLPPGYAASPGRFPVVYHLHGIGGTQGGQQNTTVPASFEAAAGAGLIGPVIVVFPNGYTDSFWADSIGGDKPAETNLVAELIPHVDQNFRTIAQPGARVIEGFSMGGFGAAKFFTKFPELFTCAVAHDGALLTWDEIVTRHPAQAQAIFGNSGAYFDQYSPWAWAVSNEPVLAGLTDLKMTVGSLLAPNRAYRDHLTALDIGAEYVETGCGHSLVCILDSQGLSAAAFIAARLDPPPCPGDANGDSFVDFTDITAVLARWGTGYLGPFGRGDANHDAQVAFDDITSVLTAWQSSCP